MAQDLAMLRIPFEQQFRYVPGRLFRADFHLTARNVLVEVQGGIAPFRRQRADGTTVVLPGAHGSVEGIMADNERLNLAMYHGYRLLRFTPNEVAAEKAITFIIDLLRHEGWDG